MTKKEEGSLKLEDQLCFPLYVASRKVISLYQPYLKKLNITYTQYIVLMVLWENDNIAVSELGRRLFLDNDTLTPLLKKMELQGYLTRQRSRKDERMVIISLTQDGMALKEKCSDIPSHIAEALDVDQEKFDELYGLLYDVIRKLSDI